VLAQIDIEKLQERGQEEVAGIESDERAPE
jgi:hypothetical protein